MQEGIVDVTNGNTTPIKLSAEESILVAIVRACFIETDMQEEVAANEQGEGGQLVVGVQTAFCSRAMEVGSALIPIAEGSLRTGIYGGMEQTATDDGTNLAKRRGCMGRGGRGRRRGRGRRGRTGGTEVGTKGERGGKGGITVYHEQPCATGGIGKAVAVTCATKVFLGSQDPN